MAMKTHFYLFSAGLLLCLAIIIPLVTKLNQPADPIPVKDAYFEKPPRPNIQPTKSESRFESSKPTKKGWLITLVPIYTAAVLIYVLYIAYRITSSRVASPSNVKSKAVKEKRKLNRFEIDKLEKKLVDSEKALEKILQKAHSVMRDVYHKELEESSLSDTTEDEEGRSKIKEFNTTSSANNDSHQDSTSTSDEETRFHQRKPHLRSKKSQNIQNIDDSSTSEEEQESEVLPTHPSTCVVSSNVKFPLTTDSDQNLDESDTEDDVSSNVDDDDDTSLLSNQSGQKHITAIPRNRVNKSDVNVCDSMDLTNAEPLVLKKEPAPEQVQKQKQQFMQTTKEVLCAMGDLKDLIKDQK